MTRGSQSIPVPYTKNDMWIFDGPMSAEEVKRERADRRQRLKENAASFLEDGDWSWMLEAFSPSSEGDQSVDPMFIMDLMKEASDVVYLSIRNLFNFAFDRLMVIWRCSRSNTSA